MSRLSAIAAASAAVLLSLNASAQDRTQPPSPGPPRPLKLPPVERLTLPNGVPVLLVEAHEVPVVEVALVIRSGAASDPAGRAGVAAMTADMLDEGAGGKSSLELADAVEFLGARLATGASWDFSTVGIHVPVARLAQALPLLADVALRPDFPERELGRLRKEALTDLLQARDSPGAVAGAALARAVFGESHRYALPQSGNAPSLAALTVADLKAFHAAHYVPGNATLVVVGDVGRSVLGELQQAFGAWPAGGAPPPAMPAPAQVKGRTLWLVHRPDSPQSVIRVGRVGPSRSTADYHALEVANTLLGGSFTSRLNDNLREQHGYTYGAGSGFAYRRAGGLFGGGADVQADATADAVTQFLKELDRIGVPPSVEETERARNYLALGYAEAFETTGQIASQIVEQVVYELPGDVFEAFVPKVLAVGADEIARVGGQYMGSQDLAIVVVGDRAAVEEPLRSLALGAVRTLSIDEVMGPAPQID